MLGASVIRNWLWGGSVVMKQVAVLGIGNTLLTDDGIGVHAVRWLEERGYGERHGIRLIDAGTLSFTLAVEIENVSHLIVIDALRKRSPPGRVHVLRGSEIDHHLAHAASSVHEVGLGDLLHIARLSGRMPAEIALIGIEPAEIGWGDCPGPAALAALPAVGRNVEALLADWGFDSRPARPSDARHAYA